MKRLTLIFLGSTGAGPAYSIEMAKALSALRVYKLHIVISKRVSNLNDWVNCFQNTNVRLDVVDTYGHNKLDFVLSSLSFWKVNHIVKLISNFKPDCLYAPFLLTWDFLIYPRLYKKMRIIATLHDPHPHDSLNNPFEKWIRYQNKKSYKYVNDVVILNKSDVSFVKANYCSNVHVIPHASFSYYVNSLAEDTQLKYKIGFIGRIEPYKGLDLLVDAFLKLDERFNLIIAGSGKIDNSTLQKITSNNRIELINRYIKDDEFSVLLNKMDVVVLPYKRASQSGVIPLVFAHGKPVIVTNVGALEEQVPEGTGIVANADVDSLVREISSLYDTPQRILDYGENARDYANSELSWDHSAKLLSDIIDKIMV